MSWFLNLFDARRQIETGRAWPDAGVLGSVGKWSTPRQCYPAL